MRRLEQWRGLAPWERRLLVRIALLLPVIGLGLRVFGYVKTHGLLERHGDRVAVSKSCPAISESECARSIARLVGIAARHGPYRANCLRQSLALCWLLRRRSVRTELRIGVRKENQEFQAHAWVEYQGNVLADTSGTASAFTAFDSAVPPASLR